MTTIKAFAELQRMHPQLPSILIRQIADLGQQKATVQSVLLRQIKERTADLEFCDNLVLNSTVNTKWGIF